jgi:Putative MetA-pathway of phenol degradation
MTFKLLTYLNQNTMVNWRYLVLIFLFSGFSFAQHTAIINSNRPGESQSAYGIGKSVFQLETAAYYLNQSNSKTSFKNEGFGIDATLRLGVLIEKVEVLIQSQYQFDNTFGNKNLLGFKKLTFGLKYLLHDPYKHEKNINIRSWDANHNLNFKDLIPAVSLYFGTNFISPLNNYDQFQNATLSPKVIIISQHQFDEGRTVLVTNTVADYLTLNIDIGFIATLTRGFNKSWSGFVEYQNFDKNPYNKDVLRTGLAYLWHDDLQIDVSVTKNKPSDVSVFNAFLGFSWRTDNKHKAQRIKIKESVKDKKKEDKEKIKKIKKTILE